MFRWLIVGFLLVVGTAAGAQSFPVCNVRDFGAKGDGATLETEAITRAVASCVQKGGGTVYFPAGRYVTGTVQLYSHIRLLLESGAVLAGSHDVADYRASSELGFGHHYGVDSTGEGQRLGILVARDAEDVSIEGRGEIDGESGSFMDVVNHVGMDFDETYLRNPAKFMAAMEAPEYGPLKPLERPGTMIVFVHCANVQLHSVTLRNAPNWTLHLQDVQDAVISGIQILNDPRVPNNDGIDCMICRHVRISDCDIRAGDDDFAIVGSEFVNVSNCSMSSRSAAIRLESTKMSTFDGLSMDTNRGIGIFASGWAKQATDTVTFSNIVMRTRLIPGHWWGKAEPIYIAVQPCKPGEPCAVQVKNVTFANITANAESGALLWGNEGSAITGTVFDNVQIHMIPPEPAFSEALGGNFDLRWTADANHAIFRHDIPGLYARWVDGLTVRNSRVDWADGMPGYFSDGLEVENFKDVAIDGFIGRQAQEQGAALAFRDGTGLAVTNSRALPGADMFLQLDRARERRVFVNYDLSGAKTAIAPAGVRFETEIGVHGQR